MSPSQTAAAAPRSQPKKTYHAPQLNALGTIEQLTQGGTFTGGETLGNISSTP
jgi:hypothetical protein